MSEHAIRLTVNGATAEARVSARLSLVDFLREHLRLTGTHAGCEHGVCGACAVLLDGRPVRSCLIFAVQADRSEITTVEGLAPEPGTIGLLQDAFCEAHGLQCGFCTPGMLIAAEALLRATPEPSEEAIREAIAGNLCRCTGYQQIVDAIRLAASRRAHVNIEGGGNGG